MPKPSDDGKYFHCSFCNHKFRFNYEANQHEMKHHSDEMQSIQNLSITSN